MIRGLGGCLIAPCRHQQGGKRKSEAFYAEHDCASTAHARFEGQRRGKWHSLSIPPSFSVGCQTFNRVFLTKASTGSEEHTSELQSLMRISYAVFCLKKKNNKSSNENNVRFN